MKAFRRAAEIHQPGWRGLALAAGLLTAILLVGAVAVFLPNQGPKVRAYGTVLTVNAYADDDGPHVRARVRTADGDRTLSLPPQWFCLPGDRIELARRGKRYTPGVMGCTRP